MDIRIITASIITIFSIFCSSAEVTEIDDIWDIQYNNRPMVIEAYASWCQPCRVYSPIVQRLSREYEGRVDFYKVNIENPDAEEFVYRYEVNSVPLTVFLWDPQGDATVKHSVERGLMGYDELKHYIEETLSKQFKQSAYTVPSSFGWSSGSSYDAFMGYTDFTADMAPFEGEWIGTENGFESKLWFFREGSEFQGVGGTLDPQRFSLVNSVYWVALGFGWDDEKNTLYISDVLPSEPTSAFSKINNGTFRYRYFTKINNKIVMDVEEYIVSHGNLSSSPSLTYTVEYTRCS